VALHEHGIDTCIETEAHVSASTFRRIAPHLDHVLIDLKHVNAAKLADQAGARCDLMLENLSWALANHPDVLPRTPVIPGFNDTPAEARAMARWLSEAGGTRVQLLPFHHFGEGKYALIDRPYAFAGMGNLHQGDLTAYQRAWLDEGIEAFF
jgi:pyruvate formate lyase activating enzyme